MTATSTSHRSTTHTQIQVVDSKKLSVKEHNLRQQQRASLAKKLREEEELERVRKFETSSSSTNYDAIQEALDAKKLAAKEHNQKQQERVMLAKKQRESEDLERLRKFELAQKASADQKRNRRVSRDL